MSFAPRCKGRIKNDLWEGMIVVTPGVNFPSDYMTKEEIAAMSSECITVTPPKEPPKEDS